MRASGQIQGYLKMCGSPSLLSSGLFKHAIFECRTPAGLFAIHFPELFKNGSELFCFGLELFHFSCTSFILSVISLCIWIFSKEHAANMLHRRTVLLPSEVGGRLPKDPPIIISLVCTRYQPTFDLSPNCPPQKATPSKNE